ncbi:MULTISPECIES: acylphosphatase [unclassified Psychrobacillus]|uniref:acylphosphatase n=1 Tax=unclassified Psychrobacillus TaxID=2636677 RepID=UPI002496240A|nr:acylphosphatase [Psychrobacillus sp. NEAU-3TGS]MDI2588960.1 acylphosphatase [Psychrobacillus sp. NEAU-3TGS]
MKKRAHILMHGDVDGVGFRFLVKQKAQSLSLKGYCMQNEQKDIIIDIEGDLNRLDEFIEYIQKGVSPLSKDNAFEIELFDHLKGYTKMESDIV